MLLTVLGCSGTAPTPANPCSAYLVEADGFRLIVDLGSGALASLQQYGSLFDVDAIVISHLHGDHWLDLVPYAYVRSFHPRRRAGALPVFAPAGLHEAVGAVLGPAGKEMVDGVYTFGDLIADELNVGPFQLSLAWVNHPIPTRAMRISHEGRSLTYSADTGVCEDLVRLADGSDLFLCEASFTDGSDEPTDVHLNGRQAAEHARQAAVGRLVLTHFLPWTDRDAVVAAAAAAFGGPLEVASAGKVFDV